MTRAEFKREFGAEFLRLSRKPVFAALLATIDSESPAKSPPTAQGDRLHGAAVFLNEIYGWERLRSLLVELATVPEKEFEPGDTYNKPEPI